MTRATLDFSPAANETVLTFHRDGSITVGGKWKDCPDEAAQAILASLGKQCAPEIERLRAALVKIDTELWGVSEKQPQREPQAFVDALKRIEAITRQALGEQ